MITIKSLKNNSLNKIKDSKILFSKKRYDNSVYIWWYSIELALKYKICKICMFTRWFPENKHELDEYETELKEKEWLVPIIKSIYEIRNHDFQKLIFYSWIESKVKENLLEEWEMILLWKETLRYKNDYISWENAKRFISSIEKILTYIFK